MKKKTLSLALALIMCLGLTVPAFAANPVTLTDGSLSVTLSDVLFEEDVTIHFSEYGEEYDETLHVYHVPEVEEYALTVSNNGKTIPNYSYGKYSWPLTLENGVWTATDGGGIGRSAGIDGEDEEAWEASASWDILESLDMGRNFTSDYLVSVYIRVKDGDRDEAIGIYFVGGDQLLADSQPEQPVDTKPTTPTDPAVTVEDIPASGTAIASTQVVTVDGKAVDFQMYALKDANGNLTNYIKLRDMAYVLNDTKAQFAVGYDGTISLTTGQPYQAGGTEMTTPYSGDRAYTGGAQTLKIDGKDVAMTAITLTDDNGGGYSYFKLRDLGKALGFNVGYSNENGVFIESDKPYSE